MKILVVDDELLLVKGMKFNLENEGYTVETAYDGATAIDMAKTEEFDLIILDLIMTQMDRLPTRKCPREFFYVQCRSFFLSSRRAAARCCAGRMPPRSKNSSPHF